MKKKIIALGWSGTGNLIGAVLVATTAACASSPMSEDQRAAQAIEVMKASFRARGQAKLDRLEQDETQRLCSLYSGDEALPKEVGQRIETSQRAMIKYPADGKFIGDWKAGERIAQSGVGKQFSDDPALPAGGNCYACHQLTQSELSYGTIGPGLYQFGKLRGYTPEIEQYAYGKIYNSQAFSACSNMPRFGHQGILTAQQIKD